MRRCWASRARRRPSSTTRVMPWGPSAWWTLRSASTRGPWPRAWQPPWARPPGESRASWGPRAGRTRPRRSPMAVAVHKWVYRFDEGSTEMRDLLGGKGAGVAEMARAGMPVPPGFTITTEACRAYYADGAGSLPAGLWDQAKVALREVESRLGRAFGGAESPLLVSVRSGARISMPGMMDTILNLGLNEDSLGGLEAQTGDRRVALDAYRRLIQMFAKTVRGVAGEQFEEELEAARSRAGVQTDAELAPSDLEPLVHRFLEIYQAEAGEECARQVDVQLRLAVEAVFRSWQSERAIAYRRHEGIPDDLGTAVNVQAMVFGNLGDTSGTGVAFTRDPNTGAREIYGDYLPNAQGEDVVAGIRATLPISALRERQPETYRELTGYANRLEAHYRDVQDVEFTIERGRLWMLQTRTAKRTGEAAVNTAVDMVAEGLISREVAVLRVEPRQLEQVLHPRIDPAARAEVLARRAPSTQAPCRRWRRRSRLGLRRFWSGPTRGAASRSGQTRTTHATPRRRWPTAPRESGSAGPSTCSWRKTGCRSCRP